MPTDKPPLHILFVDDEPEFLRTVTELFQAWAQGTWLVHATDSTAGALAVLQQHSIHLVVLDVEMPVMDGLQLLSLLSRKYPKLRKVILTGHRGEEHRAACLAQGAELFLEKPRTKEGFETVFASLNELAALEPAEGFRGMLRLVGLQDLIQMECLARNSSILEISQGQANGRIFIEQGSIVHAELGAVKGEAAFNNLLFLRGGEFVLKPYAPPPERSIEGKWEFLLMEAARMRDELEQLSGDAGPGEERQPPAESAPSLEAAAPERPTRIDEFIVCSGAGEVLYDWQCRDLEQRMKLLGLVAQRAGHLAQSFPLGRFDRLELLGLEGRAVILIQADKKLFLRSSRDAAAGAPPAEAVP